MFRRPFQIRKPISPTWFETKKRELAEIANALKALNSGPKIKENCQQLELEVIKRQDPLGSLEYKSIKQRKKEIAEEESERKKRLAKSIKEKQVRAKQIRTNTPQTRSQFWQKQNASKIAEIKRARLESMQLKT